MIFIMLKQKEDDQECLNQIQWSETAVVLYQWYLMPLQMTLIKVTGEDKKPETKQVV
jgi:hypothetical protein